LIFYLLDTNVIVNFLRSRDPAIIRRILAALPAEISLCSIVLAELYFGAFKAGPTGSGKHLALLAQFVPRFPSLPFDDRAAETFGRLRSDLSSQGKMIGVYDLQIASIALANGMTLVTHNTREFRTVPGLRLEDWQTVP